MRFGLNAAFLQRQHDVGSQLLQRVRGRCGKIALPPADAVSGIRLVADRLLTAAVPLPFDTFQVVVTFVLVLIERRAIEDKELGFRAKVRLVSDGR